MYITNSLIFSSDGLIYISFVGHSLLNDSHKVDPMREQYNTPNAKYNRINCIITCETELYCPTLQALNKTA